MIAARSDAAPWYAEDALMAERVDRAVRESRALKILIPEASVDGKWEVIGRHFHIWADSYAEMCEQLRDALAAAP